MTATDERKKKSKSSPVAGCSSEKAVPWGQLTREEKNLYIAIGTLIFIAAALAVAVAIYGLPKLMRKNVCLSDKCVRAAGQILQALDESADPCRDFYQFTCGKWIRNNPVPDTQGSWNQFDVLEARLNRVIREILERENNLERDLRPVMVARDMYQTCMDEEYDEDLDDLRKLVTEQLDGVTNSANIGRILGRLSRIRTEFWRNGFLIHVYVDLDLADPSRHTVFIDTPSLWLSQPYFLENSTEFISAYSELIAQVWELVYPSENGTKVAADLVQFSAELANNILKQEDRRNKTAVYKTMKLSDLANITRQATILNWNDVMDEVFKPVPELIANVTCWDDLQVVVADVNYFAQLGKIIEKAGIETIHSHLKWGLLFEYASEASSAARQMFFHYTQKTKGTRYPLPRWKYCTEWITASLGQAVSYHYALEQFDDMSKAQVEEMFDDMKTAFDELLRETEWMDNATRIRAEDKLRMIRPYIAYPNYLKNNVSIIIDYYKNLRIAEPVSHLRNFVALSNFSTGKFTEDILKPRDYQRWKEHAAVVNAFYYSSDNAIYLPAGILQLPFYGHPIQALNYGGIGWVIGHEITHGFDDEGRQKDGDGKLVNWWDDATLERFMERASCFVSQYNHYFISEVNVSINGVNTQGENIADNGAMHQAFRAYVSYKERHGEEQWLPGLKYSPDQLFFIAYGQFWCKTTTKESLYDQIMTDAHAPEQFRVNGVLRNFEMFAKTWGCPAPENTCRIW